MEPPRTLMERVYTPTEALRSADALERAISEGHRYFPPHKYDGIRKRIAHLRAWARQELN